MKQRVGPMVRGMLITKPNIMLERIMLPQPQQGMYCFIFKIRNIMKDTAQLAYLEEGVHKSFLRHKNRNFTVCYFKLSFLFFYC